MNGFFWYETQTIFSCALPPTKFLFIQQRRLIINSSIHFLFPIPPILTDNEMIFEWCKWRGAVEDHSGRYHRNIQIMYFLRSEEVSILLDASWYFISSSNWQPWPKSTRPSAHIPSVIPLPPTCWKGEPIYVPSKPCWDMKVSRPHPSTPILTVIVCGKKSLNIIHATYNTETPNTTHSRKSLLWQSGGWDSHRYHVFIGS